MSEESKAATNITYEILAWIGWAALGTGAALALSGSYVGFTSGATWGIVIAVVGIIIVAIATFLKRGKKEAK